jgi:hypothetical protein
VTKALAYYLTDIYFWLCLFGILPSLIALSCNWKSLATYKILGDHVKNLSFYDFNVILQNPHVATQFLGRADFFESLPDELKARVIAARRQIGFGMASIVLWVIFVFAFGALAAYLTRHSQS